MLQASLRGPAQATDTAIGPRAHMNLPCWASCPSLVGGLETEIGSKRMPFVSPDKTAPMRAVSVSAGGKRTISLHSRTAYIVSDMRSSRINRAAIVMADVYADSHMGTGVYRPAF